MPTVLIKMNVRDPDLGQLRDVAKACREGKVAAFPTETVYGIGVPMSVPGANEILSRVKDRPPGKPFSYHIGEWDMVDYLEVERTPAFRYLTQKFWPGPLTLLVPNRKGEIIGLRFPNHFVAAALINVTGEPFLGTSANMSGQPSPHTADDVMSYLDGRIDYLIDGGKCEHSLDSTIVSLENPSSPAMIRKGVDAEKVEQAVNEIKSGRFTHRKILIVCTGNSCRSPMAEYWLRDELHNKGLDSKIEVSSCGIGARKGMGPTPEAVYVMKNREIDISEHRSRPCEREDVVNADLIIAMSQQHYHFVVGMVPEAKDKIRVLNVMDPIGMGMNVYEDVIGIIEKKIKSLWKDITG